ncbi:tol-pal system YbgF family protein [Candidatus Neomarinimicrobiota bacterium]
MKHWRALCGYSILSIIAITIALLLPVKAFGMESPAAGSTEQTQTRPRSSTQRPRTSTPNVSQELRRINGRLAALKSENDSLRARIMILERVVKDFNRIIPDLRASLQSTVQAKASMDSSELALVNRLSLIMNKIRLLEDKAGYIDSTNFEILSQLVLLENKIISLTSSFNDIMAARQGETVPSPTAITDEDFRKQYIEALTTYQNGIYRVGVEQFTDLVNNGGQHELADNAQYWLAECYYAMKNFKRAITEFEHIFNFTNSDKADDARYKIALSYWNVGSHDRARVEYRKLLDEYPDSELTDKARRFFQSK